MYTNILQAYFVQAHSGLHGSLLTKKAVAGKPATARILNIY